MRAKELIRRALRKASIKSLIGPRQKQRDPNAPYVQSRRVADQARKQFADVVWPTAARRAIYALTPPARLRNVGDQAQVVAIEKWLEKNFPDVPAVELNKDITLACMPDIASAVTPDDIIFLHSGGNLGDRGRWSETARRLVIQTFPDNRIISLPQTIFFSATPVGESEKEKTRTIYGQHRHLTVVGRDQKSGDIAKDLFPLATVMTCPDFVLSLDCRDLGVDLGEPVEQKIMLCLREDDESALSSDSKSFLANILDSEFTLFDTTLKQDIEASDRIKTLADTLRLFQRHRSVVTDRFHGLIFSVLCRKPTVVLRTVDHKLTSAFDWFKDIPNVVFCDDPSKVPAALERAEATPVPAYPDFNALYFNPLARYVRDACQ